MNLKFLFIPALLSLAICLAGSDTVNAQRGGKGGGGPPPGGGKGGGPPPGGGMSGRPGGSMGGRPGGIYYGGTRPGYYGGGFYPNYGYGGIRIGVGVGSFGYGYGYPYYGYGGSFYAPSYPSAYNYYVTPQYSYVPPAVIVQPQYIPQGPPAIPEGSAQIRVLLPNANAKVWFDGSATQQTGTDRYFHTPKLPAESTNTYRIRAAWMQDGEEMIQERVVTVTPGQSTVADFR